MRCCLTAVRVRVLLTNCHAPGGRKSPGRRRGGRSRKPRDAVGDAEAADGPGAAGALADRGGRPGGARAGRSSLQTYDNPAFVDGDGTEGATNAAGQVTICSCGVLGKMAFY